ncbi:MAG: pantoate--beta-alanine ligase [Clostridia bacterium]|nr:pantoate--beta-alanine ligase [Clostridia bacterium]
MQSVSKIKEVREIIKDWKSGGFSIGFVATMGYLHAGHKSLIELARQQNDRVVVSVFVNPTQFGPNEDFAKYPRDIEHDWQICQEAGADLLFAPAAAEMYPDNNLAYIDLKELGDNLCGASRPGHFRGVCTVVGKLFNIITPDQAYFGQKDAQQLAIIKKMVKDLNFAVKIIACPIVREPDGLALSSRNAYLSTQQRQAALILSQSLQAAQELLLKGERDTQVIREFISDKIASEPLVKSDYIELVDTLTLKPVKNITAPILVAAAIYVGKTRLIDNFLFEEI